jgi:Mg2+/citrate symporter
VKLRKRNKTNKKENQRNPLGEMNKHTEMNKQETKQTNKHTKKLQVQENRISVFVVLVLFLQHPVLVLVFKQKLCLSLASFFPVFQCQMLSQLLPQRGVAV